MADETKRDQEEYSEDAMRLLHTLVRDPISMGAVAVINSRLAEITTIRDGTVVDIDVAQIVGNLVLTIGEASAKCPVMTAAHLAALTLYLHHIQHQPEGDDRGRPH